MATVLEHTRRKLDVETVHHLVETGRIGAEERVELVDGELLTMPAIGSEHAGVTAELVRRLIRATGPEPVLVTGTTPLRLDRYNQVRPDVLVLRQRDDDGAAPPTPADTLLVIEVSDATRAFDRGRKAELYARFAVAEYWVVDLVAGQVLVHRAPAGGAYGEVEMRADGGLAPTALPDATVDIAALLP
ncbi:MAG: Uma2 family endonuclease [Alphaproteobacteria bacterium]|jgi:Uma2 family endonuclease|nr:Uma2 family endonuclease [Alphaproteobacteria bacterium]